MSDRSGCATTELAILQALDTGTQGRPRAYVRSEKALALIDGRIGLGPRYAYEVLLDLARPWVIPIPTVAVVGDRGDRTFPTPVDPDYTECRPSHSGRLVLEAEAHRLAPIPVGLINGTAYRGGNQPPLEPSAVLVALRRLLKDPHVSDADLISIAGRPYSATGCSITGDLAALHRGRRVVLRESGQISITGVPVPKGPADPPKAPDPAVQYHVQDQVDGETFPVHLVIESLPARTVTSEVAQAIANRASHAWSDPNSALIGPAPLPVTHVEDQSGGDEVRILLTLDPDSSPVVVRDQLATIRGISAEAPSAFSGPLAGLLRTWVDRHRMEDIAASLDKLENAMRRDRQREKHNH